MRRYIEILAAVCGIALSGLALVSCKNAGRKALLPNISGKAGEVLVVIEKSDWEGAAGAQLREHLCADCPFLPQREPLYSLVNVTPGGFGQMFQLHRNIILMNINAGVNVPGVVYRYNKWAQPQLVITINASSDEECVQIVNDNARKIIGALEQMERDRVIANTKLYQERKLTPVVEEFTGGTMVFPSGYSLKKKSENFIWISYETTYVQQGIFIYKYPAMRNVQELGVEAIVARRNETLMREVPGMRDGSYMTTSPVLEPVVKYASYHDRKFAEVRGFWDVQGDFMGGPFVSHTFYTPDGLDLICIEAYVYAPKYDKRLYLRQVESLLYSFEWKNIL
ncbi:MAG: DUF4837 family protein [Bacteroidales bacterium]|nr:DUF4837 family protein [Bacteroidales bacterium]